jgi:uncharacterized membrane protein YphA (DoxX/SURF4 family)
VQWGEVFSASAAVPMGLAFVTAGGIYLLWRWRRGRSILLTPSKLGATPERLALLMGWLPLLLAVHTAVPLIVGGIDGQLLVPNLAMRLPADAFVGLLEIAVALLLFYGIFARYAGLALAATWLLGVLLFGPVLLLEHTIYLGLAAFFFIAGRGPIAVDRIFGDWAGARERLLPYAVPVLRITAGFSFAWLALTEKLLNLPLALAFLEKYPVVNFFPARGIGVSDANFIRLAGVVELLGGLLLILGAFPRAVILFLWLPSNLTLALFGWRELVGHLPIYATMALLLLWGSEHKVNTEALRAGLIPMAEKPVGRGVRRPA